MEAPHLQLPAAYLMLPDLGPPIAVHRLARWRLWGRTCIIALLLVGAVPMPVLARIGALEEHGLWYGVLGLFVVVALVLAAETYFRATKTVVLYENGLAYGRRGDVQGWRWDEIEAITFEIVKHSVNFVPAGTSHKYTLDMKGGQRIVLGDHVSGIKAVGEHIRERVVPLIYQRCAEALKRGENVDFGQIRLSLTQGIQDQNRLYGWADIEQAGAGKGYFIVEPRKGSGLRRTAVPIGAIPNFDVLMTLVAEAMPPAPE
jgi:hypothetical protein